MILNPFQATPPCSPFHTPRPDASPSFRRSSSIVFPHPILSTQSVSQPVVCHCTEGSRERGEMRARYQSREKISVKRKEIERSPLSSGDRSANFASANFSKAKTSASVHTSCSAANWHASEAGRGASGLGLSDGREGGREEACLKLLFRIIRSPSPSSVIPFA